MARRGLEGPVVDAADGRRNTARVSGSGIDAGAGRGESRVRRQARRRDDAPARDRIAIRDGARP